MSALMRSLQHIMSEPSEPAGVRIVSPGSTSKHVPTLSCYHARVSTVYALSHGTSRPAGQLMFGTPACTLDRQALQRLAGKG